MSRNSRPHIGWRALGTLLILLLTVACGPEPSMDSGVAPDPGPSAPLRLTDFEITQVGIEDDFWSPRIEINRSQTLAHVYQQLVDTGSIRNFDIVAGKARGKFGGPWWSDSDVYKWIEGASYSLAQTPDPELEARVDELIAKIAAAQRRDGYLDTFIQIVKPNYRWRNLAFFHEFFCIGHLLEAAVAHHESTGKRTFLDVAVKFADHIDRTFGPGKRDGTPGHEGAELALVKLYRATGEKRYFRLAQFFIDQRGQKPSFFEREYQQLPANDTVLMTWTGREVSVRGLADRQYRRTSTQFDTRYCQDHLPVREQSEAVGHAVRAMYLYSGMADVAYETGEEAMKEALDRLHDSVALRRMYVTGGIGPAEYNEGFTDDYDLPNKTAYQETCASIGLMMWNQRMLKMTGDGRYADLMELTLYNAIPAGVSLEGSTFCYVTPMASAGEFDRAGWFSVPCCPTNMVRILPSIGKYAFNQSEDGLWVNLYISGNLNAELEGGKKVTLSQSSKYPWEGNVRIEVGLEAPEEFALHLRIPGWAPGTTLRLNGNRIRPSIRKGYAKISRNWSNGDVIELSIPMEIERIQSHPNIVYNRGKTAIRRGPVIYCLEQADHEADVERISIPMGARLRSHFEPDLLKGVTVITGQGILRDEGTWEKRLYRPVSGNGALSGGSAVPIRAVPYSVWGNRGVGKMSVWVDSPR